MLGMPHQAVYKYFLFKQVKSRQLEGKCRRLLIHPPIYTANPWKRRQIPPKNGGNRNNPAARKKLTNWPNLWAQTLGPRKRKRPN
jgi:hypothetical protein